MELLLVKLPEFPQWKQINDDVKLHLISNTLDYRTRCMLQLTSSEMKKIVDRCPLFVNNCQLLWKSQNEGKWDVCVDDKNGVIETTEAVVAQFVKLFSHPKSLFDSLDIMTCDELHRESFVADLTKLVDALESSKVVIRVSKMKWDWRSNTASLFRRFLEMCDPVVLNNIAFAGESKDTTGFEKIADTPHWKKLKGLFCNGIIPPTEVISHMARISLRRREIPEGYVQALLESFTRRALPVGSFFRIYHRLPDSFMKIVESFPAIPKDAGGSFAKQCDLMAKQNMRKHQDTILGLCVPSSDLLLVVKLCPYNTRAVVCRKEHMLSDFKIPCLLFDHTPVDDRDILHLI